jgi:hypothetical protein
MHSSTHRTTRRGTHRTVGARCAAARAVVALALAPGGLAAQRAPADAPLIGRWNLQVADPAGGTYPSWLELSRSGDSTLVGRFVSRTGSARPVAEVTVVGGTLRFAIPRQWEDGPGSFRVEGRLAGERLEGTLVTPEGPGARRRWTATRAPDLVRPDPPGWGAPIALFDGTEASLARWAPQGDGASHWRVVDGVLTNTASGANLRTTGTFDDFALHLEFRYPPGGNSGVYLRGRYEVQIEDTPARTIPTPLDVGGIYGFVAPNAIATTGPGAWQTYDVTLVGRRVTVVLNGRVVVADQLIPGMTGGALDADEGTPGPLLLQGDHTAVEFRNIVLRPAAR